MIRPQNAKSKKRREQSEKIMPGKHTLKPRAGDRKSISATGVVLPFKQDTSALECQPNESPQAYEAWNLYKDLKFNNDGGTVEVGRQLRKSTTIIQRWSSRWKWKERFRLYQNLKHLEEEALRRREMESRARKWATRRIDLREDGFEVGKLLIERGRKLLSLPTFNRRIPGDAVKVTAEMVGTEIPTTTILEFREHPKDGMQYVREGIKLQRLSADMSTERLAIDTADLDADLDAMSEEELLAYAQKFQEIREAELKVGEV